ncbi:MAG TPA: metallophosphoesterase [bacterium]|nr:metallophosphoesterase [bacterium]
MPEKLGIAFFILVVQALEAFLLVRGLKVPVRFVPWIIAAFVVFNLPLPYALWLQTGARQPSSLLAALVVRPFFSWQFNWLTFLVFLGPVIGLVRLGALVSGSEAVVTVLRWGVLGISAAAGVLAIYGLWGTIYPPEVKTVEIFLPGLDPQDDGLRIAQLSDLHAAWWNSRAELQKIGDLTAAHNPDLLLITGDMVDHNPDYVYAVADGLEQVKPRLGKFAVIGNHDVYTGREAVASRMEERGFHMLRGECVGLEGRGARLSLAGYDDSGKSWTSGDPAENKTPRAVEKCPPGQPVILLAHRPPRTEKLTGSNVALTLSGHTHGGQFRIPFGGPGIADFTFPHAMGLYHLDGHTLYVTRGTGTVGWPFRLFCPPEITIIVLRSPSSPPSP